MRRVILPLLAAALLFVPFGTAGAADTLRVGKAIQNSFQFALLDAGIANGLFAREGLAIKPVTFSGAAKVQQALTSNDIDIGLSTGQDMGFIAKGLPALAVAAISNAPRETVFVVPYHSPIRTVADLRGKRVAVSNIRGYPSWLTIEFSKREGWGADGLTLVPTGSQPTSVALLRTGQVDVWAGDIGTAIDLEQKHEGRTIANMGDYVPPFMNLAIYATDRLITARPDLVRRFVKAWFDEIAWARGHRDATIRLVAPVVDLPPSTVGRVYDVLMPGLSRDGRFDPRAMATMPRAIVELGILDREPDVSKFYTTAFLPKN